MAAPKPNLPASANQRDETIGRASIIASVKTPLGFFALVLLVTEVILGGLATKVTGRDLTLLLVGMLVVLITLVVVVALSDFKGRASQREIAQRAERRQTLAADFDSKLPEVFDKRLDERLRQVRNNVQLAARRNNATLTEEISNEINGLVIESGNWSRGELHTSEQRYNSVALTLYDNAKESIFSTTIRDYIAVWPEDLLEKMIEASETSRAKSITRVFVFSKREEIDEKAIQVLRRFTKCSKIQSFV